jgi:threonine dehydrogenase-like Zn-dependent dehydrogenase
MGEVVEVGPAVINLKPGDRVVVPFCISCGRCWFCNHGDYALCDNSNPNAWMAEKEYGHSCAGIFGYSHTMGGYAGGQAQYVRVPFADVGPFKLENGLPDEKVLFLTDIFPTGYQAAEYCNIQRGDTVAVWGCGPVGQFAIRSAFLLGAERVFAIDDVAERLDMAAQAGAETPNFDYETVYDALMEATGGMGPDSCIDAVGLEAHGYTADAVYDRVKTTAGMATDRISVLRQAIQICRKSGTVSIPGVYAGYADKFPLGSAFGKGLTIRTGQTHVQRYVPRLMRHIENNDIDPSFVITHRFALSDAADAYRTFHRKSDGCVKVVMKP